MSEVVLKMEQIVKEFPGVRALDNVNFEARAGEVLALVGENGAGKSTLMKVLGGVWPYPSYQGDIFIKGENRRFYTTREAEESGVAIIYQELNLIPELSVAENIFLDRQPTNRLGAIDWRKLNSDTQTLLDELGIRDFKPADQVKHLTVGKQQMVEIAKALSKRARILVLDEPTSALTDREVAELFRIIRKLKQDGVCMCYISHKMEEIKQIADRVVVLRDGQTIGDVTAITDITLDQIIARMVGRDIKDMFPAPARQRGEKILEVRNLEVDHPDLAGEKRVRKASFSAYRGEILGIAGLMGAGRTELVSAIFGACPDATHGEVLVAGNRIDIRSPADAIDHGIALLTEDRKAFGLFLGQSIAFNTTIASLPTISSRSIGVIDAARERALVEKYVAQLGVKTHDIDSIVGTLSGGNQQKVILGRWLNAGPKIFILDEPTRGIDIGAKVEIYKLLDRLAGEGVAIVMISSELPEVLGMSDRILVMREGAIVAEFTRKQATKEAIMEYATGARRTGQ
ncbi:MAG: sugar ABC transporter ATP-binding protein [Bradyrhizobium sp.]|uniref:sugar ABC transporter ATP-binding protein n=1 Tax=Bradyrhizobium sp. TaxID=376 RepID=UPI001221A40A|nr:sugar ABC transporter ATP-binding protein [Bradyrhizobium sp.]THD47869.1 MAG: sugar ABC transporter ATP-binding protein [Bradyrhizobium sp.]